ncbi:DUF2815 family protein [Rhodoferax sp.]|uniref:DUF2815 family protein n=1 Tax=Rhodoferax sp. TaxID=50421 RepID=UPI002ACD9DCE|nr:DUF2815 family protein [Rhodoferax sp.]MDZ7918488.1 DUF2815 family protein [Rhodoferax sp.]
MKVKLQNVRLAFPALFEAKTVNGEGAPAFGASFLIEPGNKALVKSINDAIDAVATEKWGAKAPAHLALMRKTDKVALHDGDLKAQYAGFAGMLFVSSRSAARPLVLDKDKSPLNAQDGRPYGGCYVNATVELWAQDNKYGKRVNAQLLGVQFFADGDSFGGGAVGSADDFDDLAQGAEEDALV